MLDVKTGAFRHVYGEPIKDSLWYIDLRLKLPASDANNIAVNSKYFAVPYQGGGGMVAVIPQEKFGKMGKIGGVNGHTDPVLDVQFNPFNESLLATASIDSTIKLWSLNEDAGYVNSESIIKEPVQSLSEHEKKVTRILFHPVAQNVLASTAVDKRILLWDIEVQKSKCDISAFPDPLQDLTFNINGSLLAATCRDKMIRIIDPRAGENAIVATVQGHTGGKPCRAEWLRKLDMIFTAGFSSGASRDIKLWDPRNLTNGPVHSVELDSDSGILMPFFDEDTSIMLLAGKGNGNIRTLEITKEKIFKIGPTGQFSSSTPQRGMALLPKLACDVEHHEVMRAYKVTNDSVIPISFKVPRKSESFQSDIFPDTFEPKAALDAKSFFEGNNGEPTYVSMRPGERPEVNFIKSEFKPTYVKSSPKMTKKEPDSIDTIKKENEELKKELETLKKENEDLKSEVGVLKQKIIKLESSAAQEQDVDSAQQE